MRDDRLKKLCMALKFDQIRRVVSERPCGEGLFVSCFCQFVTWNVLA